MHHVTVSLIRQVPSQVHPSLNKHDQQALLSIRSELAAAVQDAEKHERGMCRLTATLLLFHA